MILVLCDESDTSALWAAEALKKRGLSPIVLTGAALASVTEWRHTVGAAPADCEISFPGGGRIRGSDAHGVLNRLSSVPWAWQKVIGGPDREYALQEMYAFYLSWLHALPGPKLNPPTPQGLCGNWRHPSVWTLLAARAGLPARPFRQTSADDRQTHWPGANGAGKPTVHVVGSRAVGPEELLRSYGHACEALTKLAGAPLLGVEFTTDRQGKSQMSQISILPDLASGGEALADALFAEFTR